MWRDILIILAVALTMLMYFGLTPRRLSKYAKAAKGGITKRNRIQKSLLISVIAITPFCIFIVIWGFRIIGLTGFLATITFVLFLWCYTLIDVWEIKLSQRGEKVANVGRSVIYLWMLSLMITSSILSDSDRPLWQKLAPPLGGTGIGAGILVLSEYIRKKREDKRPSKEEDK